MGFSVDGRLRGAFFSRLSVVSYTSMLSYPNTKLTKIVATIGPASDTPELIERLILSGVNIIRFNFKHGEVGWHQERVQRVRQVANKLGVVVGVMMDLQGPSFRIILDEATKEIKIGDRFVFGSDAFTTTHPHIIPSLRKGQILLVDDGTISFVVCADTIQGDTTVEIESRSNALLLNRKSLNIPGADFPVDLLTERDLLGIQIAIDEKMEIVAFSFARTAQDIVDIRKKLTDCGCTAQICAKLETAQSLENLEEIVKETDSVMVARGDLGVETPLEQVPLHQKRMIETCLRYGKSVITATQMMSSMEHYAFPTRAEVSDVANAILDRTDAIMLSGESASGLYPAETVAMMSRISEATESQGKGYMREVTKLKFDDSASRVAHAAHKLCLDCIDSQKPISAFVVFTSTGRSAKLMSHFRSGIPIFAITGNKITLGALCLDYAVMPVLQPAEYGGEVENDHIDATLEHLKSKGFLTTGQSVIVLHGNDWGEPRGTSSIRLMDIP